MERDRRGASDGDVREKEPRDGARGNEGVEDHRKDSPEDCAGKHQKDKKSDSFFDLCHAFWVLSGEYFVKGEPASGASRANGPAPSF